VRNETNIQPNSRGEQKVAFSFTSVVLYLVDEDDRMGCMFYMTALHNTNKYYWPQVKTKQKQIVMCLL